MIGIESSFRNEGLGSLGFLEDGIDQYSFLLAKGEDDGGLWESAIFQQAVGGELFTIEGVI